MKKQTAGGSEMVPGPSSSQRSAAFSAQVGQEDRHAGRHAQAWRHDPSVEVTPKLARAPGATVDYPLGEYDLPQAHWGVAMLDRRRALKDMAPDDCNSISHLVDGPIRDARARHTSAAP